MKHLIRRVTHLIFKFEHNHSYIKWEKHPLTLDYEYGVYRQAELVKIIKESVIHFALTSEEIKKYKESNDFGEMDRKAWDRISKAKKNQKGDYGELLLFLILSVFFPSKKFVTKVRLRSSMMDQIKGFDCAHFTIEEDKAILWLGEAKFHNNFSNAINGAVESINEHCNVDYLNDEISILGSNIELNEEFEEYDKLDEVLNGGISLDNVKIRIPVLLTYDSSTISKYSKLDDDNFIKDLEEELIRKYKTIEKKDIEIKNNIEIIFIVFPFESVGKIKDDLEMLEAVMR